MAMSLMCLLHSGRGRMRGLGRAGRRYFSTGGQAPKVVRSVEEFRAWRKKVPQNKAVGFVPTMGALHVGHLDLMKRSKRENDISVASVFVNPTQFGPNEDFNKYPREGERDLKKMQSVDVDVVFMPEAQAMYSPDHRVYVTPEGFDQSAEGSCRPGHFRGVCTIVAKLFNIVQPSKAYFGQKDAMQSCCWNGYVSASVALSSCHAFQLLPSYIPSTPLLVSMAANCLSHHFQTVVIRRLVEDLNFDLQVVVCPTVRERDGLALSSRNAYLTSDEREAAPVVYAALTSIQRSFNDWLMRERGPCPAKYLREKGEKVLREEKLIKEVQYISVASRATMEELDEVGSEGAVVSLAVKLGNVRLIDNVLLGPE